MAVAHMYSSKQLLKTFLQDVTQKNKLNTAIEEYMKDQKAIDGLKKINEIPFSSERKYSACIYSGLTLVLGAPEVLLEKNSPAVKKVKTYTDASYRVVVFGDINGEYSAKDNDISKKFHALSIIAIEDPIRDDTAQTLELLTKEHIQYRIISGDSPDTVVAIAKKINKDYPVNVISSDELDSLAPAEKEQAILTHNVFARIKPQQKQLIIKTLKKNKLFTIMVGDGVNDVLALRESDLSIAMNGGSTMAKDVSDVVLLNNSFATLPILLYEGRRIITNIQTIANIYLIKNIASISAILMLGFIGLRFPFDPKHVELSSFLIIGIPSFVLAFENHKFNATDDGFLKRLLLFSGIIGYGNAIIYTILYTYYDIVSNRLFYSRSILLSSVIFLGIFNIILIYLQNYSFKEILRRKIVMGLLIGIFSLFFICVSVPFLRDFFNMLPISPIDYLISFAFSLVGTMIIGKILKLLSLLSIGSGSVSN